MSFIDKVRFGNLSLKEKEISLKDDEISLKLQQLGLYDKLFEMHPPENSSEETKADLKLLSNLTKNISDVTLEFCKSAEKDSVQLFVNLLKRHGITEITKKHLEKVLDQAEPLLFRLKDHYNRARPNQVAYYYNIDLAVPIVTVNANHPAYPAGHSYEGYILANLLAEKYPKHKESLLKLGKNVGLSRIVLGLHYKSDHEFGRYLGKLLIDNDLIGLS
jgi:hypothetical protein